MCFETFHCRAKCNISVKKSHNHIQSMVEVWFICISFLCSIQMNNEKEIINGWKLSKYGAYSNPCFLVFGLNTEIYRSEKTSYLVTFHAAYPATIVRASECFATSRGLYNRLRKHFLLPFLATITQITFKVSKISKNKFLHNVFKL